MSPVWRALGTRRHADPSCDAHPHSVRKGWPPPGRGLFCLQTCPQETPRGCPKPLPAQCGPQRALPFFLHAVPPVTLRAACFPACKPLLPSLTVIWVPRPWPVMAGWHLLVPMSTRKLPSAPGPTHSVPQVGPVLLFLGGIPFVEDTRRALALLPAGHTCSHAGLVPMRTDPSAFLRSPPSQSVLPDSPRPVRALPGLLLRGLPALSLLGPPHCRCSLPSPRPPDPQQLPLLAGRLCLS